MMTEKIFVKTFAYVWVYVLVLSVVFFLVFDGDRTLSFFLGSMVTVMLMSQNYRSSMRTAEKDPEKLKRVSLRNVVFRFVFYALILFIAYLSDGLDIIFTFIGFLSFKVTMLLAFLLHKGGGDDDRADI